MIVVVVNTATTTTIIIIAVTVAIIKLCTFVCMHIHMFCVYMYIDNALNFGNTLGNAIPMASGTMQVSG